MTKRVIKTGLGTYVGKRGDEPAHGMWGFQGDEVDVHENFLAEFDEHNVENGTGEQITYERVGVNMFSPVAVAQAGGEEEDEESKSSAKKAPAKRA